MKNSKAQRQDIPEIQDLAKRAWESYRGIISDEQIAYMLSKMYGETELNLHFDNTHFHYHFLSDNEGNAGFIGFQHHYEPGTTKLHRIYLVPEAKGKGLGKIGLDLVKKEAKAAGDLSIILNVNKNNPAKKFYESQGFSVLKEVVLEVGSGYVMDDYVMEFIL